MSDEENPRGSDGNNPEDKIKMKVYSSTEATVTEIGPFTHYIRATDLHNKTFKRTFIVEGLIEKGRLYEVFGAWKQGKTSVMIDLCAHIAQGKPWGDRRTIPTLIMYIAGEAPDDIEMRVAAYLLRYGINDSLPFVIRVKPVYLTDTEFADDLYREIIAWEKEFPGLPVVLIIDTLARNFGPGNENTQEDMGRFTNNLIDMVVRPSGCAALVPHHSGHGNSERGRGSSVFAAGVDGSFKVSLSKDTGQSVITLEMVTCRTAESGDQFSFRIETQIIPGEDNFGNEISAPVLRYLPDHKPEPT